MCIIYATLRYLRRLRWVHVRGGYSVRTSEGKMMLDLHQVQLYMANNILYINEESVSEFLYNAHHQHHFFSSFCSPQFTNTTHISIHVGLPRKFIEVMLIVSTTRSSCSVPNRYFSINSCAQERVACTTNFFWSSTIPLPHTHKNTFMHALLRMEYRCVRTKNSTSIYRLRRRRSSKRKQENSFSFLQILSSTHIIRSSIDL